MSTAIVIGAGIGGLTAALALAAKGWDVSVLERAPALGPVGSCIILAPNAVNALATLPGGIAEELRGHQVTPAVGGMRNQAGRWLMRQNLALIEQSFGAGLVPIRRPDLIGLLARRLPDGVLRVGAEVAGLDPDAASVTLTTGEALTADVLIAADGIGSASRAIVAPGHAGPEFARVRCWLLIAAGDGLEATPGEIWGVRRMFGMYPMADGSIYGFGEAIDDRATEVSSGPAVRDEVARVYADFPAPVPELIAAALPQDVYRESLQLQRRALPAFHRGRAVLLGDAAHAMSPNIGQGACQAIEDAVTLAHELGVRPSVAAALAAYTAVRRPRTRQVATIALTMTRLSTAPNRAVAAVRDTVLSAVDRLGPRAAIRQARPLLGWRPPSVAAR